MYRSQMYRLISRRKSSAPLSSPLTSQFWLAATLINLTRTAFIRAHNENRYNRKRIRAQSWPFKSNLSRSMSAELSRMRIALPLASRKGRLFYGNSDNRLRFHASRIAGELKTTYRDVIDTSSELKYNVDNTTELKR